MVVMDAPAANGQGDAMVLPGDGDDVASELRHLGLGELGLL